jgi:hypothetical protein
LVTDASLGFAWDIGKWSAKKSSMVTMATRFDTAASVGSSPAGVCCESANGGLPTRLITYAWGEKYVDDLLSLALPAVLAPGNLPYVTSRVSCEVVVLTEERFFSLVSAAPVVSQIRQLCPVRLISLDDLIVAPDDKYGMALTYALHRGFSDLGESMTDAWLIFLNADFILAEGCLRNLLERLKRGEYIVAAPSYCTNSREVIPELRKRIDPATGVLCVDAREMAKLVLLHRHNTIRAKTVNQNQLYMRYMDQFYWMVDDNTLIGHQMPIAVVGMRPQRYLREPNAFWDYGLIAEFCPNTKHCVIGDSDEFLMLELRDNDVARDQITPGRQQVKELGERMISWVSPYQRDMATYELSLHAVDLPPGTAGARVQLRAFVDDVLSFSPPTLPSHVDHAQWNYHWPGFMEARHRFLSGRLGALTDASPAPLSLSEIDRAWWAFDGRTKAYARNRAELQAVMDWQQRCLREAIDAIKRGPVEALNRPFINALVSMTTGPAKDADVVVTRSLERQAGKLSAKCDGKPDAAQAALLSVLNEYEVKYKGLSARALQRYQQLQSACQVVAEHYRQRLEALDEEFQPQLAELNARYARLLKKRVVTAAPPFARTQQGPRVIVSPTGSLKSQIAKYAYYRLFGKWPRVRVLSPYWAPLRHLIRSVGQAVSRGAQNALLVGNNSGIADNIVDLPGLHAWVSVAGLNGCATGFRQPHDFDLCICDLDSTDLSRFPDIYRDLATLMRPGGTIIAFCLNTDSGARSVDPDKLSGVLSSLASTEVYFAGSRGSVAALRDFRSVLAMKRSSRLGYIIRAVAGLGLIVPRTLVANLMEAARPDAWHAAYPVYCTSITIEMRLAASEEHKLDSEHEPSSKV